MRNKVIHGEIAIGNQEKVSGKLVVLLKEPFSFKDLIPDLKGKLLVCPGDLCKPVLEKARTLEVVGLISKSVNEEEVKRLEIELKTSWSAAPFALLTIKEKIDWQKFQGKMGAIEVKEKRLIIKKDNEFKTD